MSNFGMAVAAAFALPAAGALAQAIVVPVPQVDDGWFPKEYATRYVQGDLKLYPK